jgi:hypothetical protein
MRTLAIFMAVLAISIVQQYIAGPLGLSWDLNRHWVVLASFFGGMIGVVAIVIYGPALIDKMTSSFRRLFRRPPKTTPKEVKPPGRFARLVDRFGAPVLGIGGPLTIGGWAAAALGVANGIGKIKLIAWLAVGQAFVTMSYVYTLAALTD